MFLLESRQPLVEFSVLGGPPLTVLYVQDIVLRVMNDLFGLDRRGSANQKSNDHQFDEINKFFEHVLSSSLLVSRIRTTLEQRS